MLSIGDGDTDHQRDEHRDAQSEQRGPEEDRRAEPRKCDEEFDQRILRRDRRSASRAPSTQREPSENRHVLVRANRALA